MTICFFMKYAFFLISRMKILIDGFVLQKKKLLLVDLEFNIGSRFWRIKKIVKRKLEVGCYLNKSFK